MNLQTTGYSLTKPEKSWILYDVANSAFGLIVVTVIMPIFFKEYAARGLAPELSTAWWGYANSISSFFLLCLAPTMGALADYPGWKKRLFTLSLIIGVLTTAMLFFTGQGEWPYCLALFVIAKTGWAGSNGLYDAFITDVTEPARMSRISSSGFAWGYIGSVIPFLVIIALIFAMKTPDSSFSLPPMAARIGFLIVVLWWLLFSVPLLRNVDQIHFCPPSSRPVREGFRRIMTTLRHLREYRDAFLFLLAYFMIIDGVNTVITMSVAYGIDIGLGATTMILAILTIQIVAFPCSLIWGRLSDRFSLKPLLQTGIGIYCIISLLGFYLPSLRSLQDRTAMFWLLSILVATSMGGIQALCRSFFGKLIPAHRSAEFFGFYAISGKFATIVGPFLFGITGQLTGQSRYGVLSVLVLFVIGSMVLSRVREVPNHEQ
ncbi:MFS transporter [Pelotalea chapellei]|uniref:MFS transporter n=1 Tax=Pelotalea chapellei TaxID=44671 RepID=A0ABS5U3I0_9BACT|nr:MFS transporter [Pelotalea chapellei]MBT1070184.1 MFS transporter [Pelotalea chapellei]